MGEVPGDGGCLKTEACWESHSLQGTPMEVWCAAVLHGGDVLWTGGDDGCLRAWDTRASPPPSRALPLSRAHTAGVTTIAPHPNPSSHLVATGGYDERLLLWDSRMLHPTVAPLEEYNLGGGVWRVAWGEGVGNPDSLAAACMYGGARVVSGVGSTPGVTELASSSTGGSVGTPDGGGVGGGVRGRVSSSYFGHQSKALTYGVAWVEKDLVATCAFYSKEVRVWSPSCYP